MKNTQNKLTVACISDTHGYHRYIKEMPEADILIHSGDITLNGEIEVLKDFNDWLGELPYQNKYVIAGNHDISLEEDGMIPAAIFTNAIYLCDSFVKYKGFKIWGSPYTIKYGEYSFQLEPDKANLHWVNMPEDTDIAITHGPAFGILDRNNAGFPCGDDALANRLIIVKPQLHIHGHIHPGYGTMTRNGTTHVNAALSGDPGYGIYNKPIVVEIEK